MEEAKTTFRFPVATNGGKIRRFWMNAGLKIKVGLILVGLLILLSTIGYLGISATKGSTQQALQERVTMAKLAAGYLDSWLAHVETMMETAAAVLVNAPERWDTENEVMPEVVALYQQLQSLGRQVFILDASGEIKQAEPPLSSLDIPSLAAVPSVLDTLEDGEFAISGAVELAAEQSPAILASVPIWSAPGTLDGALVVSIDTSNSDAQIVSLLQSGFVGNSGYVDIVDQNGVILFSTLPERLFQQSDHQGILGSMIEQGEAQVGTCHSCHQSQEKSARIPDVIAFAPLTRATWGVVIRQPQREAFAVARQLQQRVLILGLVAVLIGCALVWLLAHSILAPIQVLTGAVRRMAQGDLASPINLRRGDEFGVLVQALDHMRLQLCNSIDEIQAWNRELDARVRERTEACMAAQREAQQAKDYVQSVIDSLSDELVVVNSEFQVRMANAAVWRRWGGECSLLGQPCWVVNHKGIPCEEPYCTCPVKKVLETGKPVRVTHFHKEDRGAGCYVDIAASPLRDEKGRVREVIELLRDVTEEMTVKEELVRRNKQLSILNAVSVAVSQSLDMHQILHSVLDQVLELTGTVAGGVLLREDNDGVLKLVAHREVLSGATARIVHQETLNEHLAKMVRSATLPPEPQVTRLTTNAYAEDASDSTRTAPSLVHIPLIVKGKTLGMLWLLADRRLDMDDEYLALLGALGRQVAVGMENARLYADVQHKEQMRGELLRRVISAQEEERKRISRELHDETGQALSGIIMSCAALEQLMAAEHRDFKSKIRGVRLMAAKALRNLRMLIFDLRPEVLDDLGLAQAIRGHVSERLSSAGIHARFQLDSLPQRLPPEVEITVFRLVQEGVTNIIRHAKANEVYLELEMTGGWLRLIIQDDGQGFDLKEVMAPGFSRGWGLRSMSERVVILGGRMELESAPREGTTIRVHIPLNEVSNGPHSSTDR